MAQDALRYGKRSGTAQYVYEFPIGASEVFKKKGGGFLRDDGSGRLEVATAAHTNIIGHTDDFQEDFTASATEGATVLPVDLDLDNIYELPIKSGTAWADTMRGKLADISVTSSIQEVNLGASAIDVLEVIAKGATNPAGTVLSALVRLWRPNLTRSGVA